MRKLQRKWVFPDRLSVPDSFQAKLGGSTAFIQTLFRRGIQTPESARGFLNPDYYDPAPPTQLPGLSKAVARIQAAFSLGETILVWGDFDVDGQTSTTLLVSALSGFGSEIIHYIPNRDRESHGVSITALRKNISDFSPSVLLTCDTGIDAFEAVKFAQKSGVDVIITDHHQLPRELPEAYTIINPNLLPEGHALFDLPGVGVAFKLVEALYDELGLNPDKYLDLVALGIVSDVARQTADTRFLLQKGLRILKSTPRLGILELLKIARVEPRNITEETIGFVIGPRLNALGRLDDANSCVDFFTTKDISRASELAHELDTLNSRRKILTEDIFQESIKLVDDYPEYVQDYPVLVLQGSSHWHPGVIGIVASRLVDRFHKPVIMLSQDGDLSRGSARSIPGVPISALITESANLLISFGGHPMAAGVSLSADKVSQFRRDLAENYNRIVGGPPEQPEVHIDADLPFQAISEEFITDIQRLAPFGAGNPKLLFSTRSVRLAAKGIKVIGKDKNHKKITLVDSSGVHQDLLWWNSVDIELPDGDFDVAYSLDLSSYKNNLQVQATLRDFRQAAGAPLSAKNKSKIEFIDLRSHPAPAVEISSFSSTPDLTIWAESNPPEGIPSFHRSNLKKTDTLVIWTTPPNREIFTSVIDRIEPRKIIFFAIDPHVQTLKLFITKLHGLLKYVLENDSRTFVPQLAAQSIASTSALIEVGLEWIHLHGDYDLSQFSSQNKILPGPMENLVGFQKTDKRLKFMLKEVAAYRSYFKKAKLDTLL